MIKLIKLELQRNNLRPYFTSTVVFGGILLAFTYFIAYVAQIEQEVQFMNYGNIFLFTGVMSIFLFGILAATMYARLIIEEYSHRRLALLFSYPAGRRQTFTAKILIVFWFVMLSMLVCTILPVCIFAFTESIAPIVADTMTSNTLTKALGTLAISAVSVNAIGLLAMRIGFIKKSVAVTIICAFILATLYGNSMVSSAGNAAVSFLIAGISLLAMLLVCITLSHKINHMEVA